MKKYYFIILLSINVIFAFGQVEQVIIPSNASSTSLEKNMLFNAPIHYTVSQSGATNLDLNMLFDGKMEPSYTTTPINLSTPYVILIEDLPTIHSQRGAWIGWSTRYRHASKFKLEVFSLKDNSWITLADVQNNQNPFFMIAIPSLIVKKIKFTFYSADQSEGLIGLSEIFYISPEGAQAYDNLLVKYSKYGNVGIGVANPTERLSVNGNIRAKEIKVEATNWPDYVFKDEYELSSLENIHSFIKKNGHLPNVPKASEVEQNGISLGEMNKILLQKIEELTLHLIKKEKQLENQNSEILEIKKYLKLN